MIDIYTLDGTIDLTEWLKGLDGYEISIWPKDRAERAAWTGNPFIVTGDRASVRQWLDGLDPASLEVIRNHAYFWVLTSPSGFKHHLIGGDRLTVLDWTKREHNAIYEAVNLLTQFSHLAGLSKETQHLREEIVRIGTEHQQPASPVLIFGETGSGKEGTAQSLFKVCSRGETPGLCSIGGAFFKMDPGLALSELNGIKPGVANDVGRDGLLKQYSEGAIFIDDFDTAPPILQERLLRITSTPKGKKAVFRPIGSEEDELTNVWLIFATNHDISGMLKSGALRLDFLFRFEDRVLVVPPLRNRPADLPAIARYIWNSLTAAAGEALEDRILPWRSLRDLHSRKPKLEWKGNVRELAGLLNLVVSMCKMPKQRHKSTDSLIKQILAKGPSYFEWFGILASEEFTAAKPIPGPVEQILAADPDPAPGEFSHCELEIRERLGEIRWGELEELVQRKVGDRASTDAQSSTRAQTRRAFSRYLVYVLKFGSTLSNVDAKLLSDLGLTWASNHLKWLSESGRFLQVVRRTPKLVYGPGSYF